MLRNLIPSRNIVTFTRRIRQKRRTRHSPPTIFAAREHYSAYAHGYIKINSGFSEPFPNADAVETTGSATGPFFGKWAKPNCSLVKRLC